MSQEQTKRQGGGGGDDDEARAPRRPARSAGRSSARTSTRSSTRSTTCWRRTPRTSSAPTSRRAASSLARPRRRRPRRHRTHPRSPTRGPLHGSRGTCPDPGAPAAGLPRARHRRLLRPARPRSPTSSRPRPRTCSPAACPRDRPARAHRRAAHAGLDVPHGTTIVALTFAGGRRHRGRPARHGGQPDRPARHREGLHHRLLLGGRHRGPAGIALRDGAALHRRARALREDRGRPALPRRQGQQAGRHGPRPTSAPRCRASSSCRCSSATTSTPPTRPRPGGSSPTTPPAAATTSGWATTPVGSGSVFAKSSLKKLHDPDADLRHHHPHRRRGALRRRRRRHRHRRPRPHPRDLPGGRHHHRAEGAVRHPDEEIGRGRARSWSPAAPRTRAADAPCPRSVSPPLTQELPP